ncbi:MAG TPA: nucleotide exchange factor GrpE [Solirubrobacteraceae bacterium]|jgi:molecular chaperone GrpE
MSDVKRTPDDQAASTPGSHALGEDAARRPDGAAPAGERAAPAKTAARPAPAADGNGDAAEVQGDLDELVKTAAERDEYLALAQRTQADFENYRKRVARESASAQTRGCILLAKELLPALDNLDRALDAAAKDDPLLDGVRLVRSELSAALARTGIESFSPAGEVFDPSVHEAVATSEQPADGAPSGTVVEVYQPGYRLGETIIRPARVVVAA